MDTCLFKDKEIYSWKLKDEDNQYDKELLGEWKRASERKELFCFDCGESVILKAKDIREPHFSHITLSQCPSNRAETQESLKGKRLLIKMVERCFTEESIETKYKMPDGKYCTVFVKSPYEMAVDFHYTELQNINYDERSQHYIDHNIPFIHFFSGRFNDKIKTVGIVQKSTVQNLQGFCAFLNMYDEKNTIKIEYEMTEKHTESKRYEKYIIEDRMTNYQFNVKGELFYIPANETILVLIKKFKDKKLNEYKEIKTEIARQRVILETATIKALEEANKIKEKEEKERIRIEVERKHQQEKKQRLEQLESGKRDEDRKKIFEELQREEVIRERERVKKRKVFYNEMLSKHLIRNPIKNIVSEQSTRLMKVIDEAWILPPMLTRSEGISEKNPDIRESYLKELSTWLYRADDTQKELLISLACTRIEGCRFEDEWNINRSRMDFSIMKNCKDCIGNNNFLCYHTYDDGWCSYYKCVSPKGVCTRVKRSCENCHHFQI